MNSTTLEKFYSIVCFIENNKYAKNLLFRCTVLIYDIN